ncbi:TetR/AcrR family transcriptional regulator [Georgenia wangjunii]|uniref:TetR/AcrR family transcriptional regulator n=1 Tax=Georgenia wangjunii TaxID=3117730 RepID=UPI002F26B6DA
MAMADMTRDPRARRTLERLRAGMSTLMETKTLDQISVAELCRVSNVHRTTFYKHFDSVASFATDVFAGLIDELAEVDPQGTHEELVDAYRVAVVAVLTHIAQNRLLYRRLFDGRGDLVFQRAVTEAMTARAWLAVRAFADRGISTGTDEQTASGMVGAGVVAALAVFASQDGGDIDARAEEILRSLPAWWPRTDNAPPAGDRRP